MPPRVSGGTAAAVLPAGGSELATKSECLGCFTNESFFPLLGRVAAGVSAGASCFYGSLGSPYSFRINEFMASSCAGAFFFFFFSLPCPASFYNSAAFFFFLEWTAATGSGLINSIYFDLAVYSGELCFSLM